LTPKKSGETSRRDAPFCHITALFARSISHLCHRSKPFLKFSHCWASTSRLPVLPHARTEVADFGPNHLTLRKSFSPCDPLHWSQWRAIPAPPLLSIVTISSTTSNMPRNIDRHQWDFYLNIKRTNIQANILPKHTKSSAMNTTDNYSALYCRDIPLLG
jgi:hypothetical protein